MGSLRNGFRQTYPQLSWIVPKPPVFRFRYLLRKRGTAPAIHSLDESDYRAIIRTVWHVFPNTGLWSTGGTHSYVVSTRQPLTQPEFEAVLMRADANPQVRRDLGSAADIARYVAMSGVSFARYAGQGPIVTDNNAYFVPIR